MIKRICTTAVAAAFVAMAVTSPAMAQAKNKGAAKSQATAGQIAARDRQKKCGAEWKEAKAAGKVEKGMKWPQYWSACNKRLKGGA
jgi:Ni/Co efflux regulator RcnB